MTHPAPTPVAKCHPGAIKLRDSILLADRARPPEKGEMPKGSVPAIVLATALKGNVGGCELRLD